MAGTKIKDEFRELISPFLKSKMIKAERELGKDSSDYIALEKQYIINNSEKNIEANLENLDTISQVLTDIMIINP